MNDLFSWADAGGQHRRRARQTQRMKEYRRRTGDCHSQRERERGWRRTDKRPAVRWLDGSLFVWRHYQLLIDLYGNRCAACGSSDPQHPKNGADALFCVDHDHISHIARAILCFPCNRIAARLHEKRLSHIGEYLYQWEAVSRMLERGSPLRAEDIADLLCVHRHRQGFS